MALEIVGHGVEERRERTHLVGAVDLDSLGEVAAPDLARRLLQANDRIDHRSRQPPRDQGGCEDRDQTGQSQEQLDLVLKGLRVVGIGPHAVRGDVGRESRGTDRLVEGRREPSERLLVEAEADLGSQFHQRRRVDGLLVRCLRPRPMLTGQVDHRSLLAELTSGENRRERLVDPTGVALIRDVRRAREDHAVREELGLAQARAQIGHRQQLGHGLVGQLVACSHVLLVREDRGAAEEQHRQQHHGDADGEPAAQRVSPDERRDRIATFGHLAG